MKQLNNAITRGVFPAAELQPWAKSDNLFQVGNIIGHCIKNDKETVIDVFVFDCVHFICCGKVLHNLDIRSELNNLIQLVNFTASAYKVSLALPFFLYALSPKQGLRS